MSSTDVVPVADPLEPPASLRFVLGDWGVFYSQRSGKLVIFRDGRKDLAHLTIAWGTDSGELDIHVTRGHEQAMAGESEKNYESLVRVSKPELEKLGLRVGRTIEEGIVPRLMEAYRKYRPGWLGHRGYTVMFFEGDELLAWVRRAAPRVRGKYRLKPEQIVDPANYPAGAADAFYYPSILDELRDLGEEVPVSAVRFRRGRVIDRDAITLRYTLGPDGTVGWWGSKHSALGSAFRSSAVVLADVFLSLLGSDHAAKIERILIGLGVETDDRARIIRTVATILVESDVLRRPALGRAS